MELCKCYLEAYLFNYMKYEVSKKRRTVVASYMCSGQHNRFENRITSFRKYIFLG